jgi:hypothetical protein
VVDSGHDYGPDHRGDRKAGRRTREGHDGCRLCLDWTERRPHIAGAIGAAITKRYFDLGWMERMKHSQAVIVTPAGRRGFQKTFGIDDMSEPADRGER